MKIRVNIGYLAAVFFLQGMLALSAALAQNEAILEFYPGFWVGAEFVQRPVRFVSSGLSGDYECAFSPQAMGLDVAELQIECADNAGFWSLDLASIGGAALAVGNYPSATRYPFQASIEPGLDFSGHGRGCNTLTGEFEIKEIEHSGSILTKLAADFKQYCETVSSPLVGAIRYNSSVPIELTDPSIPTPIPTPAPVCQTLTLSQGGVEQSFSIMRSTRLVQNADNVNVGRVISSGNSGSVSVPAAGGAVKYSVKNKAGLDTFQAKQKKILAALKKRSVLPVILNQGALRGMLYVSGQKVYLLNLKVAKGKGRLRAIESGTADEDTCQ